MTIKAIVTKLTVTALACCCHMKLLPSDAFCLHHTTMHHVRTVFRRTEVVPIASFDLDADVDSHSLPLATVVAVLSCVKCDLKLLLWTSSSSTNEMEHSTNPPPPLATSIPVCSLNIVSRMQVAKNTHGKQRVDNNINKGAIKKCI